MTSVASCWRGQKCWRMMRWLLRLVGWKIRTKRTLSLFRLVGEGDQEQNCSIFLREDTNLFLRVVKTLHQSHSFKMQKAFLDIFAKCENSKARCCFPSSRGNKSFIVFQHCGVSISPPPIPTHHSPQLSNTRLQSLTLLSVTPHTGQHGDLPEDIVPMSRSGQISLSLHVSSTQAGDRCNPPYLIVSSSVSANPLDLVVPDLGLRIVHHHSKKCHSSLCFNHFEVEIFKKLMSGFYLRFCC